jgi:hypothetical protein
MLQQDTVQRATSYPPALYSAYEGERDEPLRKCGSTRPREWACTPRRTQFKSKQQNKRHEELISACGLVAACDAQDRAGLNCVHGL